MDIKRTVLWTIFIFSLVLLFDSWQRYNGNSSLFFPSANQTVTHQNGETKPPSSPLSDLPGADITPARVETAQVTSSLPSQKLGKLIDIKTDFYDAQINTLGGTLSRLTLLKESEGKAPDLFVTLFDQTNNHIYLARTGLIGGDFPNHTTLFTPIPGPTHLSQSQDKIELKLESPVIGGVQLIKTYTFKRGSYVIDVQQSIKNMSNAPIRPISYMELVRDDNPVETPMFSHTFIGPSVYTSTDHFQKISFSDIDKNKATYAPHANNGWIAMVQHYFASAWIPPEGMQRDFYINKLAPSLYRVGMKLPLSEIAPGATLTLDARLFAGPIEERPLEAIAPGLELVKDYGFVTIIAKPLFWLLEKIHTLLGNWGWSIVVLTFLIKAVFFPLSAASYKSMARMKEITPRMQTLRERFKADPQQMNKALMELYKTEKVNPFGGCLPVLIQIPVFISLYWVLLSSVEMRGAPWVLWIQDLSRPDPFFILPVLMAISMFVQTKLNPKPPDPLQAKMMLFMPLAFSIMFFFFPSGLVLYYVVNNLLSIAQQWYVGYLMKSKKKVAVNS